MFRDLREQAHPLFSFFKKKCTLFCRTELLERRQTPARTRSRKGLVTVQGGVAVEEPSGGEILQITKGFNVRQSLRKRHDKRVFLEAPEFLGC